MIKTTLGLLSSALIVVRLAQRVQVRTSFYASPQQPTAPAGLMSSPLDIWVSKPGFLQRTEVAQVHKTGSFTLVPSSLQQRANHVLTTSRGIFDKKQNGRRAFTEMPLTLF